MGCSDTVVVVACAEIVRTLALRVPVTLSVDVVPTMAVGVPVTLLWWSVVVASNITTVSVMGGSASVLILYPGAEGEGVVAELDGFDGDDVVKDKFVEIFIARSGLAKGTSMSTDPADVEATDFGAGREEKTSIFNVRNQGCRPSNRFSDKSFLWKAQRMVT